MVRFSTFCFTIELHVQVLPAYRPLHPFLDRLHENLPCICVRSIIAGNKADYAQVYGKERTSITSESDSRIALLCCWSNCNCQSIGDVDKVVQVQDQSNFDVFPICLELIVDASDQVEGHDAIFCEGEGCRIWYHQWCAGITKQRYTPLSVSDSPLKMVVLVATKFLRRVLPYARNKHSLGTEGKRCKYREKENLGHAESMQLKCSNANNLPINRYF